MTEREYETLSKFAPAAARRSSTWTSACRGWTAGADHRPRSRQGEAGREAGGPLRRPVSDEAREEHPEFEGRPRSCRTPSSLGSTAPTPARTCAAASSPSWASTGPEKVDELAGKEFYVEFSGEQFRPDGSGRGPDVRRAPAPSARRSRGEPRQTRTPSRRDAWCTWTTRTHLLGAVGLSSPLSLPYALKEAVPRLAAAVDGKPKDGRRGGRAAQRLGRMFWLPREHVVGVPAVLDRHERA